MKPFIYRDFIPDVSSTPAATVGTAQRDAPKECPSRDEGDALKDHAAEEEARRALAQDKVKQFLKDMGSFKIIVNRMWGFNLFPNLQKHYSDNQSSNYSE